MEQENNEYSNCEYINWTKNDLIDTLLAREEEITNLGNRNYDLENINENIEQKTLKLENEIVELKKLKTVINMIDRLETLGETSDTLKLLKIKYKELYNKNLYATKKNKEVKTKPKHTYTALYLDKESLIPEEEHNKVFTSLNDISLFFRTPLSRLVNVIYKGKEVKIYNYIIKSVQKNNI